MDKSPEAFRTISEVAEEMDLPQHVLRFWETRFPQIKPLKRGGGRRYYRPEDVALLRAVKQLLYGEGYTIKGVQKLLKEQGAAATTRDVLSGDGESRASEAPARAGTATEAGDVAMLRTALADLREAERLLAAARLG
jgi:DNA-binding transcriptional MerR regulator